MINKDNQNINSSFINDVHNEWIEIFIGLL